MKQNEQNKEKQGLTKKLRSYLDNTEKVKKGKKNKEFTVVTYSFLAAFLCLMGYFVYFQYGESEQFINNPYNKRQELFTRSVIRGDIYSADGVTLAQSVVDEDGNETRLYPYGRIFAHVVGYSTHGRSGIEEMATFSLLRSNIFYMEKAVNQIQGEKSPGDSVTTTLDYDLQLRAFDALGTYDGAVVVMEPETGKILAMVSKPDFDPNYLSEDWEGMVSEDSDSSALLNRATQGLYPPGSTFKIFTTLAYIQQNQDYNEYVYQCNGKYTLDNKTIHCHKNKSHGTENLKDSFAHSCNSSYASLGMTLDIEQFKKMCDGLLFNTALPTTFESSQSSFVLSTEDSASTIMETAIGQGKTLVTPFHMALITCAIANDGVLMRPYVIDHTTDAEGNMVEQYTPKAYGTLIAEEDTAILQEYMRAVVEEGTATKLLSDSYEVYGKTGSAEFSSSSNASHSWFVGYAHQEGKKDIAVAIIVEDSGIGSEYAVPIAKEIFEEYYIEKE
ncbi:MAG: penicillin-binding transpeptidase domain-containing protein [Clostridiales bacterium]|nr:penicillin-binding transpeptidase domain-containing protein [Clostridiales bacterium]